ncbi:hypothetical protein AB0A69_32535 [Streptomyces sp. NPDC045431]|uniref:hypothetical protein n=1 Tax=Streptomyces sp. NPDC045431 TaxID=3155613 RepID=UPI0033E63006
MPAGTATPSRTTLKKRAPVRHVEALCDPLDNATGHHDHILARPRRRHASGPSRISASVAWTTTYATLRSAQAFIPLAPTSSRPGREEANRVLAVGRASVEHGCADLKSLRALTELRTESARGPASRVPCSYSRISE